MLEVSTVAPVAWGLISLPDSGYPELFSVFPNEMFNTDERNKFNLGLSPLVA